MSNRSRVVDAVRSFGPLEEACSLPVLTDVLVPSADAQGRTLWLAWDDQRVPVLTEEVRCADEPALPRWARKRI